MTRQIIVSIIMPIRNEEAYIAQCIDSLLQQDYPQDNMEYIFIDGNSTDQTKSIIKSYMDKYPNLFLVLDNINRTVPYAMNIGIEVARGQYIIRLDAHCEYAKNYISKCVYYLENTDADNVGGLADTKGKGYIGESLALMLSSTFGVGNSKFRINGKSGYVDTVPFGAFRREIFEKYGNYNIKLTRNQDNEMNYRIRSGGGKIFLASDIHFVYFCRNTISGILEMAFQNGKWNIITYFLCPGVMSNRHFIPFISVVVFLVLLVGVYITESIFIKNILYFILGIYLLLNCIFAIQIGIKNGIKYTIALLLEFPLFHFCYGLGSLYAFMNYKSLKNFLH